MGPFVIACVVIFAGMLSAVYSSARRARRRGRSRPRSRRPRAPTTIKVTESEWKVQLPATSELKEGNYTFQVHNAGKVPHNLAIQGPDVPANDVSPTIAPGGDGR